MVIEILQSVVGNATHVTTVAVIDVDIVALKGHWCIWITKCTFQNAAVNVLMLLIVSVYGSVSVVKTRANTVTCRNLLVRLQV